MDKLQITAHITGPLVTTASSYFTLDALLASAVFDRTGSVDAAHNDLPLANTSGLWHASAAVCEPIDATKRTITQAIRPDVDWWDFLQKNKKGGLQRKFDAYNIMNTYREITAPTITWYCEGDADKITDLLRDLPLIGVKRSTMVTRWCVETGELDGVMGYMDEPLRPIPASMWKGDPDCIKGDATWRPAYWSTQNSAICALPN
jgi:hypothetical protein